MNQSVRLNKFLAARLGVSRREADDLISAGKVTINGKKATLGDRVSTSQTGPVQNLDIRVNGKPVPLSTEYLYLAFNKPIGYVCSRRAQGSAPTIYEILPKKYHHLKTVGRLDKDSSGLILLTNDGDFAFQMTHPKFHKEKIYEVELDKPLEPLHQQMISDFGIMLDDGPSKFTVIRSTVPRKMALQNTYTVILAEGRNRQIRRTFAALGYKVTKLHRTQFGKFELGKLKPKAYEKIIPARSEVANKIMP